MQDPLYIQHTGAAPDQGPQFFCLHGWNGDYRTFDPLLPHLPADAGLTSCDMPGYGRSPAPKAWDIDTIAEQIAAQLERSSRETPLTLIGSCSGALLGMWAARRLPKGRVTRVIMLDTFAYVPGYFKLFLFPLFGRVAYYSAFANPLGRWLTNAGLANKRQEETDLTASFSQGNVHVPLHYLRAMDSIPSYKDYGDLDCEFDIVYGANTFTAVKHGATLWKGLWPHARIWELPETGHLPLVESTEVMAQIAFSPDVNATHHEWQSTHLTEQARKLLPAGTEKQMT